jgi:hypothetical protein
MLLNWSSPKHKSIASYRRGITRVYQGGSSVPYTSDYVDAATADIRCPRAMVEVTWGDTFSDLSRVITSNDINRIDRAGVGTYIAP